MVRVAELDDIARILPIDHSVTTTRRNKFLLRLFAEQPNAVRVAEADGQIRGYLTVRFGSDAIQLGPCIAETSAAGGSMLTDAMSRHAGSRVYWDIPSSHSAAVALAQSAGLVLQRQLTRMCRGEQVNDEVAKLWASSGPELG